AAHPYDPDFRGSPRDAELFGALLAHEPSTTPYLRALEVLRADGARALLKELVASASSKPAHPARWVRALRRHRPARQASGLPIHPARRAPGSGLAAPTPSPGPPSSAKWLLWAREPATLQSSPRPGQSSPRPGRRVPPSSANVLLWACDPTTSQMSRAVRFPVRTLVGPGRGADRANPPWARDRHGRS